MGFALLSALHCVGKLRTAREHNPVVSQLSSLTLDMSIPYCSRLVVTGLFISTFFVCVAEAAPQPVNFQVGNVVRLNDPTISLVPGNVPLTSLAVDLRGNGKKDLIVGMGVPPSSPEARVPMRILRSRNGALTDVTRELLGAGALPSTEHPLEVISGDFNRDGRTDVFMAAHGYDTTPFDGERSVLLYSKADGTLEDVSSTLSSTPQFSHSATTADINGDGFLDIYVGNIGGISPSPHFLMGKADGTFERRTAGLPPAILSVNRRFTASLLLDVNDDGAPDLVLGTEQLLAGNTDSIILLNDGTGDFTKRTEIKLPRSVFGANQLVLDIAPLDVNGDGRVDLVVCGTQTAPYYQGRFLQLLIANGDGTFRDETATRLQGTPSATSGPWNRFVRIADFNSDGALDLITDSAQDYTGVVIDLIWLNDGSGQFSAVSSLALADRLGRVDVIDIDDDGRPDLVEIGVNEGILQYKPFLNRTPVKPLSKRGGVDLDGNNRSVLVVRSAANQIQSGRLVNNVVQWTTQTSPSTDFRLEAAVDFLGNGKSDLVTLNMMQGDRGDANVWPDFASGGQLTLRQVRTLWRVDAVGDLDGDGFGDLVWRFTGNSGNIDDTGVSYVWFTNGNAVTQVRKRGGAPLDWTLLGAADINADSAADMVYISPTNAVRVLMATPSRTCANINAGTIPTGFRAQRLADFTGNKRGDVLMVNAAGQVRLMALNAVGLALPAFTGAPDDPNASCTAGGNRLVSSTTTSVGTIGAGWEYLASGDFDGDGIFDVAWKRPNGGIAIWLLGLNGTLKSTLPDAGTLPAGFSAFPLQ